ncbi:MAG: hypothetical protein AMXMBFR66_25870 [Pseudomonadota bacterium]
MSSPRSASGPRPRKAAPAARPDRLYAPRRGRLIGAAALLAAALAAAGAAAEDKPYSLGASQTFTRDSNLLRLGDGQAAPAGYARSDTVSSTALLGALDQKIGRQRVYGSLTLRDNRLEHNSIYDNQSQALALGLDWETVERLSGSVKLDRARSLATFAAADRGFVPERNTETTQRGSVVVRRGLPDQLQFELGLDHQSVDYSAALYAPYELRQSSVSLGARLRTSAALLLSAGVRRLEGSYPKALQRADGSVQADDFRRTSLDLRADWQPSGASRLALRLSPMQVRYEVARERDYSGLTGALTWAWQPGARLNLTTDILREPAQDSSLLGQSAEIGSVEYSRLSTSLRVQAGYELSAKIQARAGVSYRERQTDRSLVLAAVGPIGTTSATDHATTYNLGLTWQPTRGISLGCTWQQEARSASSLAQALHYSTYGCFGQLLLN